MKFSKIEIRDLIAAWILISIAMGIALRQGDIITSIAISALTVGIAFLLHELAHKYTAQKMRKFAEFRANYPFLGLAILISFSGFVFAAPGAVIISGFVNRKENGLIAAAGPLANIVLALILLPIYFVVSGTLLTIVGFGFIINAWLALFNLLPFGMFDGAKIIAWNKVAYASLVATSFILVFLASGFL